MWEPQGYYSKFMLKQPTILFGKDAIQGLHNLPCAKCAVIYGKGFKTCHQDLLTSVLKGKTIAFFKKKWEGEPTLENISENLREIEEFRPDIFIAVGGGSVLDGSKIIRLLYEFPYFDLDKKNFKYLEFKSLFIAIPTTIGSGAEVSSAAVLYNQTRQKKEMIVTHSFIPSIVILMPEIVQSNSTDMNIKSSIDAISHIIEGYVSCIDNDITNILAEKALEIFRLELSKEEDCWDYERLQYAGYIGGITQNHCLVGVTHAIAHQLTAFGFSHSEAIALLLPHVIDFNINNNFCIEKYAALSQASGFQDTANLHHFIEKLCKRVISPETFEKSKVMFESLINNKQFIENTISDPGGKGNTPPITEQYIINLMKGFSL